MDDLITQDNLILMRFSEVVIDHIEKLGVTAREAEQAVYNAWQELGRAYANPNTKELQESRTGDCDNVRTLIPRN
jgi:hypothetical protein